MTTLTIKRPRPPTDSPEHTNLIMSFEPDTESSRGKNTKYFLDKTDQNRESLRTSTRLGFLQILNIALTTRAKGQWRLLRSKATYSAGCEICSACPRLGHYDLPRVWAGKDLAGCQLRRVALLKTTAFVQGRVLKRYSGCVFTLMKRFSWRSDFVFARNNSNKSRNNVCNGTWRNAKARAGLPKGTCFNTWRHTFSSIALRSGNRNEAV